MMAARSHDVPAPVLRDIEAVVLDTDGVITDSAKAHATAWKTAFDTFLTEHPPEDAAQRRPFDAGEDHLRYVDGRSRLDGATAFLVSRGLDPAEASVHAVAGDKERLFTERLREHGVEAGRRGGFALVVGVDRADGPDTRRRLLRDGADVVVTDLSELFVEGAGR